MRNGRSKETTNTKAISEDSPSKTNETPSQDQEIRAFDSDLHIHAELSMFPIFDGCSEWTLDPYWKEIFNQCAKGHLPKGMRINRQNIVTLPNGSSVHLVGNSQEVFRTMMRIFRNDMDLRSEGDASKKKVQVEEIKNNLRKAYSGTWKQIKLKNAKLFFLLDFVVRMSKENKLIKAKSKRLMSDIRLGLLFGSITSDDIEYADGRVDAINGLSFSEGSYMFDQPVISRGKGSRQSSNVAGRSRKASTKEIGPSLLKEYLVEYSTSVVPFEEE